MFNHTFLDSWGAVSSELESGITQIITNSRKISQKMEMLTTELLSFKVQLLESLQNLLKAASSSLNQQTLPSIINSFEEEAKISKEKLFRLRLHQILKRKVVKKRKESVLHSSLEQDREEISQLERSVILIEKDLGMENQDDLDQLAISAIINRSMAGLQHTPFKPDRDFSIISQSGSSALEGSIPEQSFLPTDQMESAPQEPKQAAAIKKSLMPRKKRTVAKEGKEGSGLLGNLLQETYGQVGKK